jgi:cobaltochelatase CobN
MHILVTTAVTLDEAEVAVDLAQSPADVVILSFSDSDLSAAAAAWQSGRNALPSLRLASLKRLKHPMSVDLYIDSVVQHAKAVIVRGLGGLDYWRYGFERVAAVAREKGVLFAALPGDDRPDDRLAALSTVPSDALQRLDVFFREGGPENAGNALRFVAHLLGRATEWQDAKPIAPAAVLSPDGTVSKLAEVTSSVDARPCALVVFYRASLLAGDTAPMTEMMRALAGQGLAPVAVAVTSLKDPAIAPVLREVFAARRPAVILNATAFSALRDDDTSLLDEAGVPVLQVVLSGSTREAWEGSTRGVGASDMAMNIVLPELDGRLMTRAVSFKSEAVTDPDLEYASTCYEPVPDRIDYVARLAAAWARLSRTPRPDRRLALVLSDYPQRGGRAGYAVGLDSAASVADILDLLSAEGFYAGVERPSTADVEAWLSATACSDASGSRAELTLDLEDYRRWLDGLPDVVQQDIREAWGAPEEDNALAGGAFRFPILNAGHVTVALQPDRGSVDGRKQGYHDGTVPPRHSYVAFYAALRERQRIDAMIHLGTHGTLEWLPGKAVALSSACCPEVLLGPIPVVYPFIVNNPGEAVQAKRRLGAVTLGHLTPPLSDAGLHGPLAELEGFIEEYAEADGVDPRRVGLLETEILERAWRSGLARDCGLDDADDARAQIAQLDAQLCDIKELAIRDGLHVFGRAPEPDAGARLAESISQSCNGQLSLDVETLIATSAENERANLVRALDGRRVAPGPSGAPTRGRADVLPTGRNLTALDPRAIPTRTAAVIGARGADEVVKRYLQDHGDYPRSLMLDLWASASLRTGGDDLAQALAYLGVRPVWDFASNRVTGVEGIPQAKLSRPRIDVTLRISGLFRDIFASQIAFFEMAVVLVAGLEEEDAWNPLAAARRRGESLARVFGGAPGTYGAGAAELALDGDWTARSDLGAAYLASSSYAYGKNDESVRADDEFRDRVRVADALVHSQDDRERDILDGDGVADFAGGFSAAAAGLGRDPALYHLDTSKEAAPRVRTVSEEVARIVRGRLTNPSWIEGMLAHRHRGVAEMAQGVDALFAFAASASAVPGHLFDAVHDALIADDVVAAAILDANPAAADAMARRLEDAIARGLWAPRRNAVREELERMRLSTLAAPRVEAAQ